MQETVITLLYRCR